MPSVFVTTMLTAPAACAGVVAVMDVLLTTVTPVSGDPPMLTVAPARKPAPAIVTLVPPVVVPLLGVIEATVGAELDGGVGGLGSGLDARPPPQPGNDSKASSNQRLNGRKFLGDIRGSLYDGRKA